MDLPPTRTRPAVRARTRPLRVVVVGGGAGAVMTAHHLLAAADESRPVEVTVVERDGSIGPGLPYRTANPWHLLNNYAGRLSAIEGDPDHLVRWAAARGLGVTGESFLPRGLYGAYLAELAATTPVPAGSARTHARGEVVDVRRPHDRGLVVEVADVAGTRELRADHVVLALGTPPPHELPHLAHLGTRYVADPWRTDLASRAADAREVLVIGTGLTMVDVVCAMHHDRPDLRFTAVSRHGLLPAAHRPGGHGLHDVLVPRGRRLDDVLATVEEALDSLNDTTDGTGRGRGDWRDVVDSLRADANDLWDGFTDAEQDTFVASHARRWDVHRHRMAPDTAIQVRRLLQARVVRVEHPSAVDPGDAGLVVNATGPRAACEPGWNPLVDRLLASGVVRPHRLGLGMDLDRDGHPVGTDGTADDRITVLGAARRGREWEVTAIPDLRTQSARLAAQLTSQAAGPGQQPPGSVRTTRVRSDWAASSASSG